MYVHCVANSELPSLRLHPFLQQQNTTHDFPSFTGSSTSYGRQMPFLTHAEKSHFAAFLTTPFLTTSERSFGICSSNVLRTLLVDTINVRQEKA